MQLSKGVDSVQTVTFDSNKHCISRSVYGGKYINKSLFIKHVNVATYIRNPHVGASSLHACCQERGAVNISRPTALVAAVRMRPVLQVDRVRFNSQRSVYLNVQRHAHKISV